MRRIVEFGLGSHTRIHFQEGDMYLATDPNMHQNFPDGIDILPECVQFYAADNFAISDVNGTKEFVEIHSRDGMPVKDYTFRVDDGYHREGDEYTLKKMKCLTLDTWLKKYSEQGFLDHIDFLYCNMIRGTAEIWYIFSFRVKPEVIVVQAHEQIDKTPFEAHGYTTISLEDLLIARL